jgi:hypothetical protein
MSKYGLKVYNPFDSTKYTIVTPNIATVISSGSVSMPDTLKDDDTYGVDIDLPGSISKSNIGVLVFPVIFTFGITSIQSSFGGGAYLYNTGYMDSTKTYYKHDKSTGVMTSWTAGNLTATQAATFDHVAGMFPVAFWDLMGQTDFTKIRLFSAMCYLVYDSSTAEYIKVYSIGSVGVSVIHYKIAIRNYNY